MIEFVRAKFGRLDLLVNNAGITSPGRADILDATEESFDTVHRASISRGPYFLTQAAARLMIESAPLDGPAARGHQCLQHLRLHRVHESRRLLHHQGRHRR